jgi:hypothetical protein
MSIIRVDKFESPQIDRLARIQPKLSNKGCLGAVQQGGMVETGPGA